MRPRIAAVAPTAQESSIVVAVRRTDDRGRVSLGDLVTRLGWSPGPLTAVIERPWVELRPAFTGGVRNTSHITTDGRLALSTALRAHVGTEVLIVGDIDGDRILVSTPAVIVELLMESTGTGGAEPTALVPTEEVAV